MAWWRHDIQRSRWVSADAATFAGRAASGRIVPDPAIVGGFAGQLITRVGGETQTAAAIVCASVHDIHAEDHGVADAELLYEPALAETELLADAVWILGKESIEAVGGAGRIVGTVGAA